MIFFHKCFIVGYRLSNVETYYIKVFCTFSLITHQRLLIVILTGLPVPSCTLQRGRIISHGDTLSHKYLSLCLDI